VANVASERPEPYATLEICRGMLQALVIQWPQFDESLNPILQRVKAQLDTVIEHEIHG
jgi:hypothetical protein